MKRFVLFSLVIFLLSGSVAACPFCGCGNSNFQIGILPNYTKAFVGVRYTYSQFNTLSHDGSQFSHDYFHSTELWGGYQVGKFQMMAFVPYLTAHKNSDDGIINDHGLGDVILMSNYKIWSAQREAIHHDLQIGIGVKLRTGHSNVDVLNPDFTVGDFTSTPGTGSTDFLVNAMHSFLHGKNGLITNATYRINTKNQQQYQYGNRVYLNTALFHTWSAGPIDIRPSLGLNLVVNAANRYQGQAVPDSQGYILSGTAGVNLQYEKVGLVLNGFLPVSQNLFDGQTHFQARGSVGLTFSF